MASHKHPLSCFSTAGDCLHVSPAWQPTNIPCPAPPSRSLPLARTSCGGAGSSHPGHSQGMRGSPGSGGSAPPAPIPTGPFPSRSSPGLPPQPGSAPGSKGTLEPPQPGRALSPGPLIPLYFLDETRAGPARAAASVTPGLRLQSPAGAGAGHRGSPGDGSAPIPQPTAARGSRSRSIRLRDICHQLQAGAATKCTYKIRTAEICSDSTGQIPDYY